MSFGKAKIQRFNDIKPCAPSPAAYNVTLKDKAKGVAITQGERFVDPKGSLSDTESTNGTPKVFKTPTLLKRKKCTAVSKPLPTKLFPDFDSLNSKVFKCDTRDAFINDLQEQIEDFKEKITNLVEQKKQSDLDRVEFERQIVKLKEEHEDRLNQISEKFNDDIVKVNEEKKRIRDEIALIRKQHEELKEANRLEMEELKNNCDKFQVLYNNSVEECNRLISEKDAVLKNREAELKALEVHCVEIRKKHSLEIEKLQKEHQVEIQDIEFEMLKTMTELQKEKENAANRIKEIEEAMRQEIEEMRRGFEVEKKQILVDSENRINEMEENLKSSNFFTEVQLKEKLDELETAWRIKLGNQEKQAEAILKECQAISEYAVIQCEIEKNGIRNDLADKTNELETVQLKYDQIVQDYEELNTKFKALQCDLSNIIIELNETRSTMGEKLDAKMKELKRFADEKKAYEVTIKNSQVTIDVLTRRLMNSDRDVEQLKHELQDTEAKTLEYESKCLQLTNDLKQAQTFNEELEMQYESAIKLNTTEIQQLKSELVQKVEAYRAEAESSTKKLHDSQELTKEVIQMLQETHSQMETQLEHLENVNAQCKFECEQSQNELEDYRIREMDWNDEREKLENVVKEMENLLEIKQDEVGELRRQLAQAQECSDARQIQMQFYKRKVAECEKELDESAHINRRYIEQSGKYDELLQKFEQLEMENLKNKNRCLKLDDEVEGNGHWKSEYDKQREDYEQLLAKCERLEKENDSNKKKMEEQRSSQKILEGDKDALSSRVHYLENELKQLSEKYADLVGHHNTKQKIRHLADLKAKTEELTQTNMDLEVKLQAQQKTLEKLKKENADMKKCLKRNKVYAEDKENVGSPNRSLNSSRIESPFRERN